MCDDNISRHINSWTPSDRLDPVNKFLTCLLFAANAHKNQKRKDPEKTPYINHPIGVAQIIVKEGGICNLDLINASLLHDTVEDTHVTMDQIFTKFGGSIGNLVQEVTDDKHLPKQKRKDLQILHAAATSPKAKVLKLADKLYNLRDLERSLPEGWTEERRRQYFQWAFQVCEGLRGVSRQLEHELDLIFQRKGLISKNEVTDYVDTCDWETHGELEPLVAAADFAAIKHKSHFILNDESSDGVPYINHIISSALTVCDIAGVKDVSVLTATLLKDVAGKSDVKSNEVINKFGEEVGELVEELTFQHSSSDDEHLKRQMNIIEKLSSSSKIITLATILDNCRRLEDSLPKDWNESKRKAYFTKYHQICTYLEGISPSLSKDLNKIWINQGLEIQDLQQAK